MQDSNPRSQIPNRQKTECQLTNRLSYQGWSWKCELDSQRAFSPLDPTAGWLSHLALVIYMFAVANFDALAQASDIQIERRQVVFLCWMQDSNPRSQTPNLYLHGNRLVCNILQPVTFYCTLEGTRVFNTWRFKLHWQSSYRPRYFKTPLVSGDPMLAEVCSVPSLATGCSWPPQMEGGFFIKMRTDIKNFYEKERCVLWWSKDITVACRKQTKTI